jgi:hypothetical protein
MEQGQSKVDNRARRDEPFPVGKTIAPEAGSGEKIPVAGIGMKRSEITRLSAIAAENGISRNDLVAYALRRFIRRYDAGKLRIVKDTTSGE